MSVIMIALARPNPNNKDAAKQYSEGVQPILKQYGGVPINRLSTLQAIVGDNIPSMTLLVKFESEEQLHACFSSSDYLALVPLREKGFSSMDIYVCH